MHYLASVTMIFRRTQVNSHIGNYSADGGVKKKIELLESEGVEVKNGKIDLKKYLYQFD